MLPSSNPSTLKLQTNIHVAIINYLQANMFTLQLIPKVTSSNSTPTNASSNDITIIPTLTIQELDALDAARKQLVVLSDQKELIDRMIAEATKRRQLEDVSILQENVRDIEAEIEVHRRLIDKMKVN